MVENNQLKGQVAKTFSLEQIKEAHENESKRWF